MREDVVVGRKPSVAPLVLEAIDAQRGQKQHITGPAAAWNSVTTWLAKRWQAFGVCANGRMRSNIPHPACQAMCTWLPLLRACCAKRPPYAPACESPMTNRRPDEGRQPTGRRTLIDPSSMPRALSSMRHRVCDCAGCSASGNHTADLAVTLSDSVDSFRKIACVRATAMTTVASDPAMRALLRRLKVRRRSRHGSSIQSYEAAASANDKASAPSLEDAVSRPMVHRNITTTGQCQR